MFLSNWLVFKIVLAAVTGLVDYPLAADVLLVYDNANKLYLEGNSIDYVSNVVLYKGETSYEITTTKNIVNGEETILTGSLTGTDRLFGMYSAFDGNYLYVGGRGDNGVKYSRVDVFEKNNGTWSYLTSITGDNTESSDNFGWKIGACENYLIVGAYTEDTGGGNTGAAYVFKRTGATWTQQEMLKAPSPASGTGYGDNDLAINGDYAFVGASGDGTGGEVFVYKRSGTSWNHHQTLVSSDISSSDDFGEGLDLSGNYLVVGAPGENSNYGALYIFKNIGGTWTQQQKLVSTVSGNMGRNARLSIDGDYIVTGGHQDGSDGLSNSGAVYIFKKDEGVEAWTQQATLRAPTPIANGYFGSKTRIKGKTVIVGQPNDGDNGTNAGAVYIYQRSGTTWSFIKKFYSSDIDTGDQFGTSVSISENDVFVSAMYEDSQGSNAGKGYIYPLKEVTNYYITQPGTYRADLQICGIDYKTNEVEVTGTPSDIEVFTEPETDFSTSNALFSQNGFYTASGSSDATYLLVHPTTTSITVYKGTPDNGYTSYYTDSTNVTLNPATMSHDGLYIVKRSSSNTIDLYKHNTSTQTYVKTSGKFSTPYDVYKIGFLPNSYDFGYTVTNGSNESVLYLHKYNSGDTWDTPTSINLTSIYSLSTSANYGRYGISFSKKDTNGNCLLAFADSFASSNELYILNVNWNTMSTSLVRSINTSVSYSWTVSFTRDGVYLWIAQSSGATRQMFKSTDNWVSYEDVTSSFTNSQYLGSHTTTFLKEYVIGAHYENPVSGIEDVIRLYKWQDLISPTLTFDGYNQLSLTNTPTYMSSKLAYYSNVYDIGTLTSDITIEKPGEYASLTFDTSSNVAYFSNATVGTVLDAPATRAFFYGNFDDTFSDGDVTTAASNGRFYADMPETTTAFGTVSVTSSTSTSTTYQLVVSNELTGTNVLIVGGGGGGGNGQNSVYWPSAGGGGKVQNLTNQTISVGTYSIVVGNGGNGRFESPSSTAGTTSSAFGTSAVGGGAGSVGTSGTSGSGNGPGSNSGTNVGGGGGDASSGGNAGNKGGSGGDGSNVSWLDGSIYGEQVGGQAYFGGGGFGGDSGGPTTGKGNNLPGTGGGGSFGQVGRSGMVAIYSSAGLGIKYLDFDTYNKLSIQNITPTATTLKYGSNTYDLGTISNVYIENPGTYEAAITASDKFALVSNVVGTGQISEPPVYSSATPTLVDPIDITDGIWSSGNYEHYQTHSTYYLYALSLDDDDSDRFIKYDWVNLVWSDQDQSGTYSTFGTSATDTTATARSVTNPTHIYLMAGSQLHATMVNPYYQVPNYSPSLTHDTYNKLSIENITPTASTLRLGSNTYDIGTATDIYIEDTGTYEIETKDANTFALVSNVVDTVTQVGAYDSSATPTLVDPIDITDGIWSSLTYQWYQTHSTYYLYKLSGDPNDSDRFIKYDWVNLVWSDQDQSGTYSTFGTSATDTTATARSITNPTHIYLMAGSQLHATMVNPYYQVPNYSPSLTHDTYNKLSIENITPTASTLRLGSNTYDIGTATDIYIEDTGTYEIETKDSNTFAFASNTATYQVHPNTAYSNYRSIGGISAASTSLHNENITTTYSVTMWAKSASATYIVRTANSDTNASGNNTHGIFGINSSGEFSIPSWTSGDSISVSFSGTPDYRDEWHFYGFEFNDTTIKVHIDGATPITGSTGYSGQTHNRMRFDNPNAFTDGTRLAEFAVYNRALSDAEFVSIYNNGLPNGPDNVSSGRVSWFKCLSGAMGTNSGTGGDFDASFTEDTDVPSAWLDPTPSLTHDTYNKLSIENITPTASTLRLGSNTYDIGTATDIYIEDTGTYEIETKDANTFALVSNVVTGTIKTIEPGFASRYQGSMALTYDGKLYAWGMNGDGEAGVGTSSDITVPTLCTGITQGTVAKLLSSSDITENSRGEVSVIKTTDGKIYMAGKGDNYCIPGKTSDQTSFIDVTSYFGDQSLTANTITMMSFTDRSGTALTETGNVWTWGTHDSTYKALGQAGASSSSTPKQINFSSATGTITKVTCGHYHSLALDSSGDVWFWGKNGINSDSWPSSITDEPQKVVDGKNIIGIASSYGNMYAWDATGKMWNAGNNWEGQIGDGTTTTNTTGKTLTEVTYFSSNNITINKVYGGGYFVFADTSDGYYCWGSGYHGNFGNGSTGNLVSPTKWTNVSNIKKFMAYTNHTTAITEDGKYYAWGAGTNYGRGDNDTGDISYPKYISQLPNILAPSFEFDGYDKVLTSGTFVYEFYVSVKAAGGSGLHYININQMSSSTLTLKTSMVTVHVPIYGGSAADMFDGSNTTYISINDPNHEVGAKIWTLVTDKELVDLTFVADRPVYLPGWKIVCNGEIVLEDTANGGTSLTPSPATFTKTLSPITSLTKYTKGTTTYDAGKASIVTVSDPGTYDAQLKKSGAFSLKSATIPETKTSGLYTWAFHHGNFDNAYGDGDILTARENGRFYADTPSYTGDIGTITQTLDPYPVTYTFPFTSAYPVASDYPQISSFTNGNTGSGGTTIANGYMTMNGNGDGDDRMPKYQTSTTHREYSVGFDAYFDNTAGVTIFGGMETGGRFGLQYNTSNSTLGIYHARDGQGSSSSYGTTVISDGVWYNIKIVFDIASSVKIYLDNELYLDHALTGSNWTQNSPIDDWYFGEKTNSNYSVSGIRIKNFDVYEGLWPVTEDVSKTMYTFTPASTLTANVLMVAGGGGGGGVNAGGGGAGGLVYSLNESISTGSKTIVVGNGGLGGEGYSNGIDEIGIRGNDTIFLSYTASGGGGGGSQDSSATTQIDGGSGGGNNGRYDSGIGGSSTQNAYSGKGFGNVGGDGVDDYNGGGGGGAGGAGTDATGNGGTGGTGGIGKYYGNIFGTNYGDDGWFAGGGGGASQTGTGTIGLGGKGGGGRGKEETDTYDIGFHGTSHTGGGGGATGYTAANSNRIGGSGGSGIVLLQTNVATPNVNSEVKIPEPHYHVLIEKSDDIQFSHLPNGIGSGTVHTGGSIVPNIPRADGSVSNVFYATSAEYFYAEQAGSLVSTVEGIFYPIEQQRYDNILEIGDNLNTNNNDVELEMAADGTAKLYRSHGADLIAAGTKVCFTVGKWHHIALTLDTGGNAVGYVNGYPVVSATYSSSVLPGSRREMCLYRTGVTATFQKFLMYYFKTYNSVLNHKQIMQLAGAAGLGPKLEYDGLNAINVVNTEPGSGTDITIYESNVNDTSNLYVVSCNESSYLLSNAGTYYAQIKGTDTFTITRPLTVTDDHFPLYQYPPIDGTTTGLTTSTTTATWTISGVQYSTGSSVAGSPYNTFDNSITSGFDSTSSTGDITITFESSKTIRKYIVWPYDSTSPVSTPGGNTDPTLSTDGTSRPKSWVLYGTNNPNEWLTVLDTVTNQPPSIYGDVHSISSPASYQYYKLSVTANNGGSGLKIGEWQLWGDA